MVRTLGRDYHRDMAVTDANPDSFRRMDESTAEQWAHIGARTFENQGRVADRMIMLLESLAEISDGFITDQLTHCLQTATMAEKAGADEEMIFGALMHDVGKAISVPNHGAISAEMKGSLVLGHQRVSSESRRLKKLAIRLMLMLKVR